MRLLKNLFFGFSPKKTGLKKVSEIKFTFREGGNELQATIVLSEKEKCELLKESLAKFYMSRPTERNKALGGIRTL